MNSTLTTAIAASIVAAIAGSSSAAIHQWDWQVGDPGGYGTNNNGGTFESIHSTFNTDTNALTWDMTFSDQVTKGFTLALNDGPNPKGHAGELALLYVDITSPAAPKMLAYAYNGQNSNTSYIDGVGNIAGNQTPDDIVDVDDRGGSNWIEHFTVEDTMDGKRVVSFAIDASVINTHTPDYPGSTPWFGLGFGEKLGIWLHPYRTLSASYDPVDGLLNSWGGDQGWFDGSNLVTQEVPAPGPVALLAGAGMIAGSRRRNRKG
ncbi:MAG: hypothetical protein H6813_06100 [Phycisphaeraceae bacterium]|nr:hypothetical protein [Phycisphaeraceae bacterium]MCB9848042.1 hypothetical protein [Phycisphaeraceae bacterium]